ncbi:MAG: MBL fold metallo-hydrolase [Lawsonibacter sp.]|jgi:L-ascorbate metabolism protein UlaG (beta-lactamase superfamily)
MKLTWHGHSCFTLQAGQERVVLDPYETGSVPGLSPLNLQADLVLCSHDHRDHAASHLVSLSGRPVSWEIHTLSTFHDPQQGILRGPNTIHILSVEGLRLAHLGDLGCIPTPDQCQKLKNLDVLLIPVGGYYTIDAQQAQALIQQLTPRIVVPMHYRSDSFGYDVIASLDAFLSLRSDLVRYPTNSMELSLSTPAQTAILTYQP